MLSDDEQDRILTFLEKEETACDPGVVWLQGALESGDSLKQAWTECDEATYLAWVLWKTFSGYSSEKPAVYFECVARLRAAIDAEGGSSGFARSGNLIYDLVDMTPGHHRAENIVLARIIHEHFSWGFVGPYIKKWLQVK